MSMSIRPFYPGARYKALREGGAVDLRTIPAVVGGDEEKRHGVVLAKSLPAKQYGIRTGESLFAARAKCPDITVVPRILTGMCRIPRR